MILNLTPEKEGDLRVFDMIRLLQNLWIWIEALSQNYHERLTVKLTLLT